MCRLSERNCRCRCHCRCCRARFSLDDANVDFEAIRRNEIAQGRVKCCCCCCCR